MTDRFVYSKTIDEKERLKIDMGNRLSSGESISSAAHTITDSDGNDVTSTIMVTGSDTISDTDGDGFDDTVSIRIQAGTDDADYTWRALATTSDSDVIEGILKIEVRD